MQEKVQEYVLYCDADRELGFMSMSVLYCDADIELGFMPDEGSGVCFVLRLRYRTGFMPDEGSGVYSVL